VSKFKGIDVFREQVSLIYKGENSFPTFLGASVSLFVISTVLAFAVVKGIKFFNLEDPDTIRSLMIRDMDTSGYF
jgi:hypothetical protein